MACAQAVANSSVLVGMHGAATTLLLGLPPWGASVELLPYKFDEAALYYHLFGNWAAAAARTHLAWHNTNPWHASAGGHALCACARRRLRSPHLRPSGQWDCACATRSLSATSPETIRAVDKMRHSTPCLWRLIRCGTGG